MRKSRPSRQERTMSYTTVCEGGSDKVIREIARFYFMPNNSFGVTPNFS